MRVLLLVCSFLLLIALAAPLMAETCAATPEAAARAALGGSSLAAVSAVGYRVEDVQVDSVLRRVWVRVVHCDDALAPAILIPFVVPLHMVANTTDSVVPATTVRLASSSSVMHAAANVIPAAPIVIHFGDAVRAVFASTAVHMELDAVADQQGRVGETIALTVKRSDRSLDEPEHRIHGIVRADKTVEVTP